jgi:hypothetical protein
MTAQWTLARLPEVKRQRERERVALSQGELAAAS